MSVYEKFRLFICINYQGKPYKLMWFNEDAKGVYIGHYGMVQGAHFSYHQDGIKHFKIPNSKEYLQEHQGLPIAQITDFAQIGFHAIPLYPQMMAITGNEYRHDDKYSTNAIFIEGSIFSEDMIGLSSFLINRKSEQVFVDYLYSNTFQPHYEILVCNIFTLNFFPQHKLGLIIQKRKEE